MAHNIRQYFNQGTGLYVLDNNNGNNGGSDGTTPPPVVIPDSFWSSNYTTLYPTDLEKGLVEKT